MPAQLTKDEAHAFLDSRPGWLMVEPAWFESRVQRLDILGANKFRFQHLESHLSVGAIL